MKKTEVMNMLEELFAADKGSDEKVALKCGVNASTVYRWRKGKTTTHSIFIKVIDLLHSQMLERKLEKAR